MILDASSTHTFSSCSWNGCSGSYGGAISFRDHSSSSLFIRECTFSFCETTSPDWANGGGALHCYSVHSVSIDSSSFLSCSCRVGGGGGINLYDIRHQPYINNCYFISCSADDDGGGAAIWSSYAKDDLIVCRDCRVIRCSVPNYNKNSVSPVAGGIILWSNNAGLKCSNILFSDNEGWLGGAYATDRRSNLAANLLSFCFFNKNIGTYGTDTFFQYFPSDIPFCYCCSTSDSNRVGYYVNTEYTSTNREWLPQTSIHS